MNIIQDKAIAKAKNPESTKLTNGKLYVMEYIAEDDRIAVRNDDGIVRRYAASNFKFPPYKKAWKNFMNQIEQDLESAKTVANRLEQQIAEIKSPTVNQGIGFYN